MSQQITIPTDPELTARVEALQDGVDKVLAGLNHKLTDLAARVEALESPPPPEVIPPEVVPPAPGSEVTPPPEVVTPPPPDPDPVIEPVPDPPPPSTLLVGPSPNLPPREPMQGWRWNNQQRENILIENKDITLSQVGSILEIQARVAGAYARNLTLRNVRISAAIGEHWYDWVHGLFLYGVVDFALIDSVVELNGLGTSAGQPRRYYSSHGIYAVACERLLFLRSLLKGNAAQGLKIRGCKDVEVRQTLFEGNLIDVGIDERELSRNVRVIDCASVDTGGRQNPPDAGDPVAWPIIVGHVTGAQIIRHRFAGPNPAGAANACAIKVTGQAKNVRVEQPDYSQWSAKQIENHAGAELVVV
jgi:hypothetical protein